MMTNQEDDLFPPLYEYHIAYTTSDGRLGRTIYPSDTPICSDADIQAIELFILRQTQKFGTVISFQPLRQPDSRS